jgi:hypothetical protein
LVCKITCKEIGQQEEEQQQNNNSKQQKDQQILSLSLLAPQTIKFKTAFEELYYKHALLCCGINKIDSFLKLTLGDRLCVMGNLEYSHMLVTRLCVNALLLASSEKMQSRFFYTSNVILVDAGNNCNFYQYVNFTRQYYRHDVIDRVLNNIIVARVFTIYQLADILINQLPKVIQRFDAKVIVVSNLLDMFVRDPQIEANEASYLIKEITNSITPTKTRT